MAQRLLLFWMPALRLHDLSSRSIFTNEAIAHLLKKLITPGLLIIASTVVAVVLYNQAPKAALREVTSPVLLVDVVATKPTTVELNVNAQGSVTPRTQTTLVSEVAGQILEVADAFVSGGFFKKGEILARIDDRNYQAELKRAEASVAAARTVLVREKGLADFALEDWKKSQRSDAATELALRKPQVAEALAQLAFAQAELKKRIGDLERTVIRAPYDGMIRQKRADVGQYVSPTLQLAEIFATDVVEIRLPLPDKDLRHLDLDALPKVKFSAALGGKTYTWHGRIVRTEGVFDEQSRVLYAVAQVEDPYNQQGDDWAYPLRVGTFVDAEIAGPMVENITVLPRSALRRGDRVWTIGADNTLEPRKVTLLRADENLIYVQSGLEGNPLVCLTTLENPLPGTIVRFERRSINGS
jgi:RND family efflux transporter MFP subunit